nr:aspartate carbamoyltransferase 1, chloroplastic-like [Tanacetum cinerariifolium]
MSADICIKFLDAILIRKCFKIQFRPHRSFEQSCFGLPENCLPRYNEATYVAIINTTRSGDNPDELLSYREFQDTINNNFIALLFIAIGVFEGGATRRSAMTANVPVINAGDGLGQHPTQALLDVYIIKREIGKLDGIKVGLVGDLLSNGRTVRLLAYLLSKYNNVKIYFVSPAEDIKEYITLKEVDWEESADLMEVASKCDVDVLYVMQKHAAVMHPLPRLDEAAFFRQAKNGLYIRMALLKLLLLGW